MYVLQWYLALWESSVWYSRAEHWRGVRPGRGPLESTRIGPDRWSWLCQTLSVAVWEFPKKLEDPDIDRPQIVGFILRTPIKRTPNLWKQPCHVSLARALLGQLRLSWQTVWDPDSCSSGFCLQVSGTPMRARVSSHGGHNSQQNDVERKMQHSVTFDASQAVGFVARM